MAFNLFRKKEKEIINNDDDNTQVNDIVDDFGSFVGRKTSLDKSTIESENSSQSISSFETNFSENVSDNNLNNDSYNNFNNIDENKLYNNFETSYAEEINNNDLHTSNLNHEEVVNSNIEINQPFNPYLNNTETYDDVKNVPEKIDNQSIINPNTTQNTTITNLNEISNNIQNSQDINVALSNLYGNKDNNNDSVSLGNTSAEKQDNYNIEPKIEENHTESTPSLPVHKNPYQYSDVDPGYKLCPKCGQKIREDYKQCFVCGTIF